VARHGIDPALKERMESVAKTGKLTDAMRLVAAAKVRRAQDGVTKARPFSDELQGMIKGLVKKLKGSGLEAELPMLRVPETTKTVGILVISSNRGLCGSYNSLIMKKVLARVSALNSQGIAPTIVAVGKKASKKIPQKLSDQQYNYTGEFFDMPDTLTSKFASEVGDAVRNLFLSGEVDKIEIIYSKFINLLINVPTVRTLLPLSPTGIEDPEDETFTLTTSGGKLSVEKEKVKPAKTREIEADVIFDQAPETILNSMLPLYLTSQILALLYESQASELGSRMTAMKAATDNAAELAKALLLLYNKERQAIITAEICEIAAGAKAVDEANTNAAKPLGMFDDEDSLTDEFMAEIEDGSVPDTPVALEDKYAGSPLIAGRGA